VNEFNAHLESLSEHHDIPKVIANSLLEILFPQGLCHLGWTWIMTFTHMWCCVVVMDGRGHHIPFATFHLI
jgi:hypothetical protein